jgi:hypothetical protein
MKDFMRECSHISTPRPGLRLALRTAASARGRRFSKYAAGIPAAVLFFTVLSMLSAQPDIEPVIGLKEFHIEEKVPLFPERTQPYVELKLSLLYPQSYPDQQTLKWLRQVMLGINHSDPRAELAASRDEYVRYYREQQTGYADNPEFEYQYMQAYEDTQSVVMNAYGFLVIKRYLYRDEGGVHPNETTGYSDFDLKNRRSLLFADIFPTAARETLAEMIERKIRDEGGIKPDTPLTKVGFYKDHIPVTDTFYITTAGIGFYYNRYDICPYVWPPWDIFFSWEEMKTLISPESPVRRIFGKL